MNSIYALVCALVAVLTLACDNANQRSPRRNTDYSRENSTRLTAAQLADANAVRAKIGIPIIDTNWFLYRSIGNQEDWNMHQSDAITKTVFFDTSGNIVSEDDHFYSGAKYTDFEGEGFESITVRYDYKNCQMEIFYSGTNDLIKATLFPVLMPSGGVTTNWAQAMALVRTATKGWSNPIR